MNKSISAALAVLMLAALLGGCQLAVPDGETSDQDILCGVFITLEYLDTGEPDITINWKGEPEVSYPETRIYATRTEDEEGRADFTFDGIEGISFFTAEVADTYHNSFYGPEIADRLLSISDSGFSLTGTIYADVRYSPITMFPNPVYQTPDGRVYMVPGQGTGLDARQAGDNISVKLSETSTETVGSTKTSRTDEVEVRMEVVNGNQRVTLKQMDENDQAISQTEITQDSIPEFVRIEPGCEYILLEEYGVDAEGKTAVKRTVLSTDQQFFKVGFTGGNGIVLLYQVTMEKPVTGNT